MRYIADGNETLRFISCKLMKLELYNSLEGNTFEMSFNGLRPIKCNKAYNNFLTMSPSFIALLAIRQV